MIYVSGSIGYGTLTVTKVHRRTNPSGAVRVLGATTAPARMPRVGDVLAYRALAGIPPYVEPPMRAKRGPIATGRGGSVYLPARLLSALDALCEGSGETRGEAIERLVWADHIRFESDRVRYNETVTRVVAALRARHLSEVKPLAVPDGK